MGRNALVARLAHCVKQIIVEILDTAALKLFSKILVVVCGFVAVVYGHLVGDCVCITWITLYYRLAESRLTASTVVYICRVKVCEAVCDEFVRHSFECLLVNSLVVTGRGYRQAHKAETEFLGFVVHSFPPLCH